MNGATKNRPVYSTSGAFSLFFAHALVLHDSQTLRPAGYDWRQKAAHVPAVKAASHFLALPLHATSPPPMTAEIAIMNRTAVALAADSAVTLGRSGKIFNTANKLFTLSKHEPVGIMVFGNGELLTVPWENLVKMYRSHLKEEKFDHLEDYARDFIKFISDPKFFPAEQQREFVVRVVAGLMGRLKESFEKKVKQRMEKKKGLKVAESDAILDELSEVYYEKIEARIPLPQAPPNHLENFEAEYSATVRDAINEIFPNIPDAIRERLYKMGINLFTRSYFPTEGMSGVVIAGFGREDLFPCVCRIEVHGIALNWVKHVMHPATRVDHEQRGAILAFAQQDVVDAFMRGIDARVENLLKTGIAGNWRALEEGIRKLKGVSRVTRDKILALIQGFKGEDVFDKIDEDQHRQLVNPVVEAVAALPKDELAAMAESLVNLTVFRRKFSLDQETVGGPIDVAVISKWDGFIWIRRKHYFNKELNPHFVAQYFRPE
jgi:hypothetical protein